MDYPKLRVSEITKNLPLDFNKKTMNSDDLCEFAQNLNKLLEKSNYITNTTVESINSFEVKISESHNRLEEMFTKIEKQENCIQNIKKIVIELEAFIRLFSVIDRDSLKLSEGAQGSFDKYIEKLVYIKSIEKYQYLREMNGNEFFKGSFSRYENLLAMGNKKKSWDHFLEDLCH